MWVITPLFNASIHQYIYAHTLDLSVVRLRYSYLPFLLSYIIQHSQIFFISSNFRNNKSFLNLYANKVASETLPYNTQNSNKTTNNKQKYPLPLLPLPLLPLLALACCSHCLYSYLPLPRAAICFPRLWLPQAWKRGK